MTFPESKDLIVSTLGECAFPCRLLDCSVPVADEARRIPLIADLVELEPYLRSGTSPPSFEPAGPRQNVFFDPASVTCGIVTCGGLCPGINNVVRAIVLTLTYTYGVKRILGFRYGYSGLHSRGQHPPLELTPQAVDRIHEFGGTILGTSRGPQQVADMVNTLVRYDIGILFVIGGDGSLRGASALSREIARRRLSIAVVAVPKTIDNDILWVTRSFGFATAVEAARTVIQGAHEEARAVWNGVGLVKLMGRQSGFIAAHATLANHDVNFCLVPEVPFTLDGGAGLLRALERRLDAKHHAVVVVAEGAGQGLLRHDGKEERDASGNLRLMDIGAFLHGKIAQHFGALGKEVTIKYIDPSYIIRSQPASSIDAEFCLGLGQYAVHAGMAGRTDMMVGHWNQQFTHVPIAVATAARHRLDPEGHAWQRVLEATGQPGSMVASTLE